MYVFQLENDKKSKNSRKITEQEASTLNEYVSRK